jgi:hypothetical protein
MGRLIQRSHPSDKIWEEDKMSINISQSVLHVITDHMGYEGRRQVLCEGPRYILFTVQMNFHLWSQCAASDNCSHNPHAFELELYLTSLWPTKIKMVVIFSWNLINCYHTLPVNSKFCFELVMLQETVVYKRHMTISLVHNCTGK